ncbi:extracellular solute-binding protein [Haloferax sp. MBLA0076]|uniref:Extracellular solute-binding protein n=1 Tax=Haloferax litoreum TaxID=2666140 RepID=A0A6A8GGS4_9EURY|nr:substrate-binding domain-containing protein [Haloferax sp. CBA1148]KAB1193830.1 extracellular solute-binding protein [Haloferax sp. CBA1148]MRX22373.1 extracellular solute-binding protein [Haloferax litoreum]
MVDADSRKGKRNGVSRRNFVKAAGASGVAVGLAGCISTGGGDGNSGNGGGNGGNEDTNTPINTEAPTEDITVQIAGDTRMADNSDAIIQSMYDAGLPENISVEIIAGSQVTDNRQAQYQQWLNGGREEPTLLMMDSGWTIPFIARDQLQNLSQSLPSEMTSTIEDEYFQASVDTAKGAEGDLYGVPLFPDFPTMQYRKDLLRNAGYTDEDFETWATESMSWEEFSAITKEAMEANPDIDNGFTFQANVYEGLSCCDFNEFMTSYGGTFFGGRDNLFGPVGDRPITVDEEPVLNSIRMVRTLIHGEDDEHALDGITGNISPEAVLQWTEEPSRKPFTGGNAIMHRNWPYSITINGAEDVFGEDLGVMPIPYGVTPDESEYEGTGGPVAALGGWHMTMNPNAPDEQKSAAVQVLRAMMEPQFQLDNFGIQGWIPPRPELLDSDEAKEVDVIGRYLSALKVAGENAIPRPVTVVWPQQSGKVAQEVNNAYAQEKAPEQAMSDLKSQLEQIEQSAS